MSIFTRLKSFLSKILHKSKDAEVDSEDTTQVQTVEVDSTDTAQAQTCNCGAEPETVTATETKIENPKREMDDTNSANGSGFFTDPRDGKKYRTVAIGNQVWMAENLRHKIEGSWCYDNDESKCQEYGRLYRWIAANSACPPGWRLPSRREWENLIVAVGGAKEGGKKLKAKNGWKEHDGKSGNGTDDYGFSALPGGIRSSNGDFNHAGYFGQWWSTTDGCGIAAYFRLICYYFGGDFVFDIFNDTGSSFSVRCVRDISRECLTQITVDETDAKKTTKYRTKTQKEDMVIVSLNIENKTIWQCACDNATKSNGQPPIEYSDVCLNYDVVMIGPGFFGPYPDCQNWYDDQYFLEKLERFNWFCDLQPSVKEVWKNDVRWIQDQSRDYIENVKRFERRIAKEVEDGDIAVLRYAKSTVCGVGVFIGGYQYVPIFGNGTISSLKGLNVCHCRRVRWLWNGKHKFSANIFKTDGISKLHNDEAKCWLKTLTFSESDLNRPLAELPD
jgi:uncharacterized protein (TIGR02145 family)